jgi:hypothetical protein
MEESVKTPEQLVLENRKIRVVPIVRGRAFFPKGHDGDFLFSGCWRYYGLPINSRTRAYFNPFKAGEQAAFEKLLNLPAGSLNTNDRKSKFWGEFKIPLDKNGTELDLSQVDHALIYRVLQVDPKFATQSDDLTKLEYQYQLIDERYVEEEYSKLNLKKAEAYSELNKLKSKKQLVDTLRLLGIKMNDESSFDALKAKLAQIVEEPASNKFKGLKTIDDFLLITKDPQATMKLFVLDAIDNKEVVVENGDEYRLVESGKLIARSLKGAVDWFSDIANQETKLLIQERSQISSK